MAPKQATGRASRPAGLEGVNLFDLLGINPMGARWTRQALQTRARHVAFLLGRPAPPGTTAQPVPYTLIQANAVRDWLNGQDETERTDPDTGEAMLYDERLVRAFYHDFAMGNRIRSTWNPVPTLPPGAERVHIGSPVILPPAFPTVVNRQLERTTGRRPNRNPVDLTGDSDDDNTSPASRPSGRGARPASTPTGRGARPTGSQSSPVDISDSTPGSASDGSFNPAHHRSPHTNSSPFQSSWAPPAGQTSHTGRHFRSSGGIIQDEPVGRRPSGLTTPPRQPTNRTAFVEVTPTVRRQLPVYTGRTDYDLATLTLRAGDATGRRVVIGLVRPVDEHGNQLGVAPVLTVTAGLDGQGRMNFRVRNTDMTGQPVNTYGTARQANSVNWSSVQARGLVLLGRFRGATDRDIRNFLTARDGAPSSDGRLPLDDQSPSRHTGRYANVTTGPSINQPRRSRSPDSPSDRAYRNRVG